VLAVGVTEMVGPMVGSALNRASLGERQRK